MDHLTPMGVAAAYLGELVTEELKTHEASRAAGSRPDEAASKIVVVAPQEGHVSRGGCSYTARLAYLQSLQPTDYCEVHQ